MIARIEALRYKSLKYISQEVKRFQVLVGPNATGKSNFLDAIAFLGDLLLEGPEYAVANRASRPERIEELVWNQEGTRLELAVELRAPENSIAGKRQHPACRYEIAVGQDKESREPIVLAETLFLLPTLTTSEPYKRNLFPVEREAPPTILYGSRKTPPGWVTVVKKIEESGNDYFKSETGKWNLQFRFGPTKTALANLPEDATKFPVATWAKRFLLGGITPLVLDSAEMGKPQPKERGWMLWLNGSNLASLVQRLKKSRTRYEAWLQHIQTVLPELKEIRVRERPEDRHVYLTLVHTNGLRIPAWLVSAGTLRLLGLTLIPYLDSVDDVYLIEEPENGIHPRAVQAVFDSLSSAYNSQVLVATHSPVFLSLTEPAEVLCFSKTQSGATDIVSGRDHPKLRDWKGQVSIADYFAAGVLG